MAAAVSLAIFFVLWGVMNDGADRTPWIPAGLAASIVLGGAVIFRELVLRAARDRYYQEQRRLERNLRVLAAIPRPGREKLTLDQNKAALRLISQRSDAAKVLPRIASAHRDVCDICEEYLRNIEREIPRVAPGSPRLAAFRRGIKVARGYHKHHLTRWAEIEVHSYTLEARSRDKISDRLEAARRAAGVLDQALISYPREATFLESMAVIGEIIESLTVTELIEKAEAAAAAGERRISAELYREALTLTNQSSRGGISDTVIAEQIRSALFEVESGAADISFPKSDRNK
ncbi:MAG TPA: hypothetical protein VK918_02110 [Pyrinomonadaceae bacterium]|nr:hypothetical protein [Pyrinomonadaceae bacterium]